MANSTPQKRRRKAAPGRPPKPYPDFPLTPHPAGYWCKSIRGKLHYFGRWGRKVGGKMERIESDGWQEALAEFERTRDALYQGKMPRPNAEGLTVADLCNRYLTAKHRLREAGELSPRTFADYKRITDRLVSFFGKDRRVLDLAADDFEELRAEIAKTNGPVRLGGEIQQTRMVFKYGYDAGLIDRPVRFGPTFKRPGKRVLRLHRNGSGPKMFEADEIRALLDAAPVQLRAMILLGVNCGFGNADCGTLPTSAVDLKNGWIDYPRPKTGIPRRCHLWPETVEALKAALAERPKPKSEDDADLVFVTKYGERWTKDTSASPISAEFRKLLQRPRCPKCGKIEAADAEKCGGCKWKPKGKDKDKWGSLYRKGVGFYALRHTFETIGGDSRDQVAVNYIMGHVDESMAATYREKIDDSRLVAVSDHVRAWLFGTKSAQ